MALNIKNAEVERLATEIARATGETKTEAIRKALVDRQKQLDLPTLEERWKKIRDDLERDVWSKLPPDVRGQRIPKEEYDALFE
ncbi:NADPH_BDH domain containing protein [Fimbriimonadaceae bacterium]